MHGNFAAVLNYNRLIFCVGRACKMSEASASSKRDETYGNRWDQNTTIDVRIRL